ncbi:MAG: TetR/AcrR family transcriptional regulator [Thermodesulfobacteriota bacterium]
MQRSNNTIKSRVKDKQLVDIRRQEIVNAAVGLFVKKGYHETTVREIAKEFGMSMGALYDYIRTKEDILFLVCDHIHNTVSNKLRESPAVKRKALENLKKSIEDYFKIIDEIQDYMLLLYQETKSLGKSARKYIYSAELELTAIFENILLQCIKENSVKLSKKDIKIVAHDIMVKGQMWAFRRWALSRNITLNSYIDKQTTLILNGIT